MSNITITVSVKVTVGEGKDIVFCIVGLIGSRALRYIHIWIFKFSLKIYYLYPKINFAA